MPRITDDGIVDDSAFRRLGVLDVWTVLDRAVAHLISDALVIMVDDTDHIESTRGTVHRTRCTP